MAAVIFPGMPEKEIGRLFEPWMCGIFNSVKAAELLKEMAEN